MGYICKYEFIKLSMWVRLEILLEKFANVCGLQPLLHGFAWCIIVWFIRSLMNSLRLMDWQLLLASLWRESSDQEVLLPLSLEHLCSVPTVHEEYPEYFWRVKIQAEDQNFQRIRHWCIPAKWYFSGFDRGREELHPEVPWPEVATPLQQSYRQLTMWRAVYSRQEWLLIPATSLGMQKKSIPQLLTLYI